LTFAGAERLVVPIAVGVRPEQRELDAKPDLVLVE
jgi:hypothetical protein